MKKYSKIWVFLFLVFLQAKAMSQEIIPTPREVKFSKEKICFDSLTVFADNTQLDKLIGVLEQEFKSLTGKKIFSTKEPGASLLLRLDTTFEEEEYEIIFSDSIKITGGSYDAVAMGSISLLQSLKNRENLCWQKGSIRDIPEFSFRSVMIDLARRKHDIATIKRVISLCRWYKINYLQLHLTDEHAFTFPSTAYPQLSTEGWSYTLEELNDLVAFAEARGVELIPELEVPGHAGQLVQKMPEIFGFKSEKIHPYTIHMGREEVYPVLDTLIGEIAEIFHTSEYIHIGGDEANFSEMEKDPEILEFLQKNNLKDMEELFWFFINKMNTSVKKHGKKTIVWEGFSKEGNTVIDKDITVMAWESKYQLPQDILNAGYQTVNVSWKPLYVVNQRKWSPETIYNWNIYRWENWVPSIPSYDPIQLAAHPNLIGASMASWDQPAYTELSSLRKRIPAFVEEPWNHSKKPPYDIFHKKLEKQDQQLHAYLSPVKIETKGLSYPDVEDGYEDEQTWFDNEVKISLSTPRELEIRYSLDGSRVTAESNKFQDSIILRETTELRYRTFDAREPIGHEMLEFFEFHPLKVELEGDFTVPLDDLWDTPEPHIIRFANEVLVQLSAKRKGEIRYGLGDEDINKKYKIYTKPIRINRDALVKAGIYVNGKLIGKIWKQHFKKEKD